MGRSRKRGIRPEMPTPEQSGALAANWRTIIGVDALLGLAVAVVGVVLLVTTRGLLGVVLTLAGIAYLGAVAKRAREWRRLRAERDLDSGNDAGR